ncbi:MAG: NADH-quinone oxidoreductase subunit C [Chloroflexia bacterium]
MDGAELGLLLERMQRALPAGAIAEVQPNGAIRVHPYTLLYVARYLLETEGFDYLSNVTGVDWLEQGEFEVVYHLYAMRRGARIARGKEPGGPLGPVVLKVRVPRDRPVVPSVTSLWPSALWQEREVYDLMGIRFDGHPDLRRIYLWEEYEDHPLRKDYAPKED